MDAITFVDDGSQLFVDLIDVFLIEIQTGLFGVIERLQLYTNHMKSYNEVLCYLFYIANCHCLAYVSVCF